MAHVQGHPRGLRMSCEDAIARGQQVLERRKVAPVERPVRVVVQLLVPLVEAVRRQEERLRVANVDGHRDAERRAGFPHRIEPRIVDRHEPPRRAVLAQIEAKNLQHLETACAGFVRALDLCGLKRRIARLVGPAPPRFREADEPSRMYGVELLDHLLQSGTASTGQVDHQSDVLLVHHREHVGNGHRHSHRFGILGRAQPAREAQMRVHVDHGEPRALDARLGHVKHALGFEALEPESTSRRRGRTRTSRGLRVFRLLRCRHEERAPSRGEPLTTVQCRGRATLGSFVGLPL